MLAGLFQKLNYSVPQSNFYNKPNHIAMMTLAVNERYRPSFDAIDLKVQLVIGRLIYTI